MVCSIKCVAGWLAGWMDGGWMEGGWVHGWHGRLGGLMDLGLIDGWMD